MQRKQLTNRIRLLSGLVVLMCVLIIARLYQLQVVNGQTYAERAEQQYVYTEADLYDRGSIFFTTRDNEKLSAASIQAGFVLAVNPTQVTNVEFTCATLQTVLAIDQDLCETRSSLPERTYVELEQRVSSDQAEQISALDLDGVFLYRNRWRYYPGDELAARSIGFVGYTDAGNSLRGKYGLERQYDSTLYRDGQIQSVNFFAELFGNLRSLVNNKPSMEAGDIITSLEPKVARMLDSVLLDVQQEYSSSLTGGIIMNPNTGEIYALNALPSFNLNDRSDATINQFRNPLVEDVYEFGSTIKALTVAAGLDDGAITPDTTYFDAGFIELDTFTIRNFDGRGRGTVPMQEVLNQSLNTGVSFIVREMGKDAFRDYFLNFKLGSESGIDLPNESFGLVENLNSPRDVEYATASFGQGIALTPIAAIRALAALGNGGYLVTPHLVTAIEYTDGSVKEVRYPEGAQVLQPETSEAVSRMLSIVVDDALRGGTVALPNHTIAAKTGTAQIPDPVNGGYYEDKFLHSFFGYFPAYEPEFIIFLYTVEPQGVRFASETLTDPFMDITRFLINYYSIPPDR
jgi:cell division protein FtsI/penicillin-binding protein 2